MLFYFINKFASAFIFPLQKDGFNNEEIKLLYIYTKHQLGQTDLHVRFSIYSFILILIIFHKIILFFPFKHPESCRVKTIINFFHCLSEPTQAIVRLIRTIIVSLIFSHPSFSIAQKYEKPQ